MNYRLLNKGETIQEGDEFYASIGSWLKSANTEGERAGDKGSVFIYRRPIANESQWVSIKERNPTKEDGGGKGLILIRYADGMCLVSHFAYLFDEEITHWCRIPAFTETDPFEDEWHKIGGEHYYDAAKDNARTFFNAGREYERSKK